MVELLPDSISDRKNLTFWAARWTCTLGYKYLTRPHVELHEETERLSKDPGTVFFYAGLHKSLWETTGIQVSLIARKIPLPYAGMGDNLVRGKFFQTLAKKTGLFLIKRATNRSEMLESARHLRQTVMTFLANGHSVMLFPEGTRKSIPSKGEYGKFFPSAFDAVLEYERQKEGIIAQYPDLTPADAYIIPFNVDYSRVREDTEMLETYKGKPRTLHITDSFSMIKNIGHTYISYGEPFKVGDHLDKNRKELATITRDLCLGLVKILPINVSAHAILHAIDEAGEQAGEIPPDKIYPHIKRMMAKLEPLKEKFRGFTIDTPPETILKRAAKKGPRFNKVESKYRDIYQLYANYIRHYV